MRQLHVALLVGWFTTVAVTCAGADEYQIHAIDQRNYELMFFEPSFLRIASGDSVTFVVTNLDHQPQSVLVPDGAAHWTAEKGESITVTFTREGVYLFDCAYHNVMGMAGVVVVGDLVNLDDARRFFGDYRSETFAINQDRLDHIWDPESGLLTELERRSRRAGAQPATDR